MAPASRALPAVALLAVALLAALGVGAPVADAGVDSSVATVVAVDDEGVELLAVPVREGTEVTIEYTHSVERTLVTDVYVVDGDDLVMDRMLFSSYGAGLPSTAPVERAGDRYVYRPDDRRYGTLTVSTGPVAGHELVVDGARYDLVERSGGGTVHLSVEDRGAAVG